MRERERESERERERNKKWERANKGAKKEGRRRRLEEIRQSWMERLRVLRRFRNGGISFLRKRMSMRVCVFV